MNLWHCTVSGGDKILSAGYTLSFPSFSSEHATNDKLLATEHLCQMATEKLTDEQLLAGSSQRKKS